MFASKGNRRINSSRTRRNVQNLGGTAVLSLLRALLNGGTNRRGCLTVRIIISHDDDICILRSNRTHNRALELVTLTGRTENNHDLAITGAIHRLQGTSQAVRVVGKVHNRVRSQRNQLHTTRHHRSQSRTGRQLGQQALTLSGVSVQVRHERRQRSIRNVKISGQTGVAFNALTGAISHVEAVAQTLTLNLHHSPVAGTKLCGHLSQTGTARSHQTVHLLRTHLLASGGEHLLAPLVISSNHSQLGTLGGEQLSLRVEVVLHSAVQIQVILSQVREASNRVLHAVHTVVINRV